MRCTSLLLLLPLLLLFAACGDELGPTADLEPAPSAAPDATAAQPPPSPPRFGDLPEIRARGALRVLTTGDPGNVALSRDGASAADDLAAVRDLAARHGLEAVFVTVDAPEALIPALLEGRGDIIAAHLTVTEARRGQVAFTRPTGVVSEIVVGRRGAPDLPRSPAELAGRELHVRPGSAHADTLAALRASGAAAPTVVEVHEPLDTEALVYEVTRGARPLTVVDSDLLSHIQTYNDEAEALFTLAEGREVAWAVRKEDTALRSAADAFLVERAMTGHTLEVFTGDLDGIKARGELRVITRNNGLSYFVYRGEQLGFDFELMELFAKRLGVRLAMVVPPSRDKLVPWLLEGRGDVIAATLMVSPERSRRVAFTRPYLHAREVVVRRSDGPPLASLADLRGRRIHVRRSSSHYETLQGLAERYGPFEIVPMPEHLETEALLRKVAEGEIELTVADSTLLELEQRYHPELEGAFPLVAPPEPGFPLGETYGQKDIAFAVRPSSRALHDELDRFVKETYRGLEYNMARKRYFGGRTLETARKARAATTGVLSPYDELIKKYASRYKLDWRLLAAQAFTESRFDPDAKSWAGAVGLFQVMPRTGRSLGFLNLDDPEQSTHAGVRYLYKLIDGIDHHIDFRQRVRFALAAYNVGPGHVRDARRLAERLGLDRNRWFGHVEKAMLLLEKPKYYKRARHGYCRGSEPVDYVSRIQSRYDAYVKLVPR